MDTDARLQPIERLVRIHDEEMQAVARLAIGRRDGRDRASRDHVALRMGAGEEKALMALDERVEFAAVRFAQRLEHRADVARDEGQDAFGVRNAVAVVTVLAASFDYAVEFFLVIESARNALLQEARRSGMRVIRARARELEQREQILDLVVRGERSVEQRRKQQLALSQRIDYAVLFCHAGERLQGGNLPS
jgi:hypothetical protein